MSITQAIARSLPKVAAAQTAYQTSVALASNAMLGVTSLTLPSLNYPPSNWDDFVTTFTAAKTNANQWASDVLVQLYSVPQSVDKYNTNILSALNSCAGYAKSLETESDSLILSALQTDLPIISSQLSIVSQYISTCQNAIQSFNDNLPSLYSSLQSLSTDFTNQEQVDQAQVTKLQADIASLNADINQQINTIIGDGVLIGGALYFGRAAGWTPTGCLVKVMAALVLACATYSIDLAADAIASDKANITNDTTDINDYTADAQNCAVIVQAFSSLISQMTDVTNAVQAILTEWNSMMADITAAVNQVSQALTDTNNADYADALTDIQTAVTAWNSVDTLANSLVLPSSVSQGSYSAGMSASDVLTEVNSSQSTDIVSYLLGAA